MGDIQLKVPCTMGRRELWVPAQQIGWRLYRGIYGLAA